MFYGVVLLLLSCAGRENIIITIIVCSVATVVNRHVYRLIV